MATYRFEAVGGVTAPDLAEALRIAKWCLENEHYVIDVKKIEIKEQVTA